MILTESQITTAVTEKLMAAAAERGNAGRVQGVMKLAGKLHH